MMRIAVAGGGGLGYLLALQLAQAANAYNVVVLSRSVGLPRVIPGARATMLMQHRQDPNSANSMSNSTLSTTAITTV